MRTFVEELKTHWLARHPLVDVRAPVEYQDGHIPGAVNLPLLFDTERQQVGTVYKQQGPEAAIRLGTQLISGETKAQRVSEWKNFFSRHPQALLYCFRGGLRSQTVQAWLREEGVNVTLLEGGYKAARQFFLRELEAFSEAGFLLVSGPTGSGKTHLLKEVADFFPAVDLEGLAAHKGSAFGFEEEPQPSQADFENRMVQKFMSLDLARPVLLEDESRLIGRRVLPEKLFLKMRTSPVLWVDESLAQRVENIFQDYIVNTAITGSSETKAKDLFQRYEQSLQAISPKLGGLRSSEILKNLQQAQQETMEGRGLEAHRVWIEQLLINYYDPLYLGSLERRQPVIQFRGTRAEIKQYLKHDFLKN